MTHPRADEVMALREKGETSRKIAEKTGISRWTVRDIIQEATTGVKREHRKGAASKPKRKSKKQRKAEAAKKEPPKSMQIEVFGVEDPTLYSEILRKLMKGPIPISDMPGSLMQQMTQQGGYSFVMTDGMVELLRNPKMLLDRVPAPNIFDPTREWHEFAVITDTHFGGYQAQPWFVKMILEEASRRKCSAVFHVGDHVDGPPAMHKGFEYELGLTRAEHQVDFAASIYRESQVRILGITGNHDGSYFKAAGINVGRMIQEASDGVYTDLGPIQAWVPGPNDDPHFMRLFHPGDGCSYALSYKDQKTMEYLSLNEKDPPSGFHFTGHYHKFHVMRGSNGARYMLAPASCGPTSFMQAKSLTNQAGALFIRFTLDKEGRVDRFVMEDIWITGDQMIQCDYGGNGWKKRVPRGKLIW